MAAAIIPLDPAHRKQEFRCGNAILDRYLHQQVSQDLKNKVCTCFVLVDEGHTVKGYYTLSSASLPRESIPPELEKKLPRYRNLPVTLLGRLAVDVNFHRRGFGEMLLIDALKKSFGASKTAVGSIAVIVDPIDEAAKVFYAGYGFILLPDSGKMFLPMKTIAQLFTL